MNDLITKTIALFQSVPKIIERLQRPIKIGRYAPSIWFLVHPPQADCHGCEIPKLFSHGVHPESNELDFLDDEAVEQLKSWVTENGTYWTLTDNDGYSLAYGWFFGDEKLYSERLVQWGQNNLHRGEINLYVKKDVEDVGTPQWNVDWTVYSIPEYGAQVEVSYCSQTA